jgi:hypothetical protein
VTTAVDDDLWSAVGDPTRRRLLDLLLADGNGTATSLSEQLPVTRQAVAKQHLLAHSFSPIGAVAGSCRPPPRHPFADLGVLRCIRLSTP